MEHEFGFKSHKRDKISH